MVTCNGLHHRQRVLHALQDRLVKDVLLLRGLVALTERPTQFQLALDLTGKDAERLVLDGSQRPRLEVEYADRADWMAVRRA
ncbi:hypothetical protein [Bosea sp. Root381]|uniref:hypothetical protein n=1 Tax=Bosea sp. Root381 TaxID=1736524 RepID=UPI0006FF3CEF|nr:hypothetical protein [Bosea sp. Root381]